MRNVRLDAIDDNVGFKMLQHPFPVHNLRMIGGYPLKICKRAIKILPIHHF